MKFKSFTFFIKRYLLIPVVVIPCLTGLGWSADQTGHRERTDTCTQRMDVDDVDDVYVVTHEEIVRSGARTLADVLARVPGIRVSLTSSQSTASAGPIVSSDSPTQLAASQFSRVLILFDGHPLNKLWHGGADQEWGTGFLEGLKEIRVYSGPAAMAMHGGTGAVDMAIDLIPFTGTDQQGVDIRLSQSANEDRWDRSLAHLSAGNRWGENGHYSIFADGTRWAGADIQGSCASTDPGSRWDRKDPTFQVGGIVQKGAFHFMARHLQHDFFDPCACGRKWSYTFAELTPTFQLWDGGQLELTASVDRIVSQWGAASSATGKFTGDWDKVKEFRVLGRVEFSQEFKTTRIVLGGDLQNSGIDGGPARSGDAFSVMNFSTQRNRVGVDCRLIQHLFGSLSLQGSLRVEKNEGYADVQYLPEVSVFYRRGTTTLGAGYAAGHRYMDTWYRVGSGNANFSYFYIVPTELKPEENRQLKLWLDQSFGPVVFHAAGFVGEYRHLMGIDWDYALLYQFNRLRAADVGNYTYWGGAGSLFIRGKALSIGANVSYQRVIDSDLAARQLYVSPGGDQPLYLPPVVANLFLDWDLFHHLSLSARYFISDGARNGGVDLTSSDFDTVFDTVSFPNTASYSTLDVSLRLFDILKIGKKFEIQLSAHNVLNDHPRLVMVEGGSFLSRGRELTLTLRHQF
ncbi:MAG: TonB-dependent receptor plug domain-containing protein [Candidatus Omnitrophota bacterium]